LTSKLFICFIDGFTPRRKSQSLAYLLNGSEHIYIADLDLETEVHSIWVIIWTSNLQEFQGQAMVRHAKVGIGQGRGTEALAFLVLPLPTALTRATLDGGI
jgi:hypothetical protein